MSKTVKLTVSDENYIELEKKAGTNSVQDYIRSILFPEQVIAITPEIAVKRALTKYSQGDTFSVPEIFEDEWNLSNGYAGVLGRRFNKLINNEYSDKIRFTNTFNRKGHAIYEII